MPPYLWNPPAAPSLPVRGKAERLPINRLFFVGRNYHAHAVEMGKPVDKTVERPFYFTKAPQTLVESGATVAYPPETSNYHFEMELVVAIGKPGFRVKAEDAHIMIYGYAAGLDMTRRDLQLVARDKGRPWDLGKDVEQSSVCSEIVPMEGQIVDQGAIALEVVVQRGQADLERARNHRRPFAVLPPAAGRPDLHRHARRRGRGAARRPHHRTRGRRGGSRAERRPGGIAAFFSPSSCATPSTPALTPALSRKRARE